MSWRRGVSDWFLRAKDGAREPGRQLLILIQVCCLYSVTQDYGITFSLVCVEGDRREQRSPFALVLMTVSDALAAE